jgi:hypothetical protein
VPRRLSARFTAVKRLPHGVLYRGKARHPRTSRRGQLLLCSAAVTERLGVRRQRTWSSGLSMRAKHRSRRLRPFGRLPTDA